jgi:hypothetical protein
LRKWLEPREANGASRAPTQQPFGDSEKVPSRLPARQIDRELPAHPPRVWSPAQNLQTPRNEALAMIDSESNRTPAPTPTTRSRSDERLREDVCDRLMLNEGIDCSDVSVDVHGGVVILEGSVPQRQMRYVIEDLAAECRGVKDVENCIRVARLDAR